MAYTLLDAVNRCLKRVRVIQGDAGVLTTLTDAARQADVDIMVQAIQETVQDLYEICNYPREIVTGTITLVSGTREYAFASDFEGIAIDKILNEEDGYDLLPYPGGYTAMFQCQEQPDNYNGTPYFYAINPENGFLRLDRIPQDGDAGRVYKYKYHKTLQFDEATDTFPFSDLTFDNMMPAIKEVWNRESKEKFDAVIYQRAMARAVQTLRQYEQRTHW